MRLIWVTRVDWAIPSSFAAAAIVRCRAAASNRGSRSHPPMPVSAGRMRVQWWPYRQLRGWCGGSTLPAGVWEFRMSLVQVDEAFGLEHLFRAEVGGPRGTFDGYRYSGLTFDVAAGGLGRDVVPQDQWDAVTFGGANRNSESVAVGVHTQRRGIELTEKRAIRTVHESTIAYRADIPRERRSHRSATTTILRDRRLSSMLPATTKRVVEQDAEGAVILIDICRDVGSSLLLCRRG